MNASMSDQLSTATPATYWGMSRNTYLMLLHLSQLSGWVVPLAGWILPVVMWVSFKDRDAEVDAHGRSVLNWMISSFIYLVISALLCLVLIGFALLFALAICALVFAVLGAVKANDGVRWDYPLSIRFFRQNHG